MFNGLFSPTASPTFNCPTGNCSWPAYSTLGICSKCTNVTYQTQVLGQCQFTDDANRQRHCTYRTPNKKTFESSFTAGTAGDDHIPDKPITGPTKWYSDHLLFSHVDRPYYGLTNYGNIANITVARFEQGYDDVDHPKPTAFQCSLRLCQKTTNGTLASNGALHDQVQAQVPLIFPNCEDDYWWYIDGTKSPIEDSDFLCPGFTPALIPGLQDLIAINHTLPQIDYPAYWVSAAHAWDIGRRLEAMMNVSLSLGYDGGTRQVMAETLYSMNNGNISKTIESVANSLTNYIRQAPNATLVQGTASISEVFVQVHWPWLFFPALLVAFSTVFLVTCMTISAAKGKQVWKSSIIALLFHRLAEHKPEDAETTTLTQMHNASKQMFTRLGEDDDGNMAFIASQEKMLLKAHSGKAVFRPSRSLANV